MQNAIALMNNTTHSAEISGFLAACRMILHTFHSTFAQSTWLLANNFLSVLLRSIPLRKTQCIYKNYAHRLIRGSQKGLVLEMIVYNFDETVAYYILFQKSFTKTRFAIDFQM